MTHLKLSQKWGNYWYFFLPMPLMQHLLVHPGGGYVWSKFQDLRYLIYIWGWYGILQSCSPAPYIHHGGGMCSVHILRIFQIFLHVFCGLHVFRTYFAYAWPFDAFREFPVIYLPNDSSHLQTALVASAQPSPPPPRQTLQQCAGAFTAMQQRMLELDELYRKEVRERKALYNAMQVLSHPEQRTRPTLSRNARGETKWPTLTSAGVQDWIMFPSVYLSNI